MSHPESDPVTVLRAGIEDIEPDHWVVSIFDLFGCFSSGRTELEAVARAPGEARAYFAWLARKDGNPAPFEESVQVAVIERIATRPSAADPGRRVHGLYEEDRRPLRLWDVDMALRLLEWNRQDLLAIVASIPGAGLETPVNDPVWQTARGLVEHVCGAEQWLLHNLGLDLERATMPRGTLERLDAVRRRFLQVLPDLAEKDEVREVDGELWSPRKMVRRALWHERDHTRQLEGLLAGKM